VAALDEPTWEELTLASLALTNGATPWAYEVAKRAAAAPLSEGSLRILLALVASNSGDPWDRHYVQSIAIEALERAASDPALADEAAKLRNRLVQVGRHELLRTTEEPDEGAESSADAPDGDDPIDQDDDTT
jgi:hypothetical protein